MKKILLLTLFTFGFTDCPDGYALNPLFIDGFDDYYEECVPSEFIHYTSYAFAGYFFFNVLLNEENITSEDWVGAFNGDVCVGSHKWDISQCGQGVCSLNIYGDDGDELTQGYMQNGGYPTFKIFDTSTGEYLTAIPSENFPFNHMATHMINTLTGCEDNDFDGICDGEMPECSEMDETVCTGNDDCEWIENIELESCNDIHNQQECNAVGCSWYNGNYYACSICCWGEYEVDNSYCEETEYQLGDLNQDSVMNIQDVIIVINLILNGEFDLAADINLDNTVNVLDVIQIVNIILN